MFPLVALATPQAMWAGQAWTGGWLQLFAHAFAKAGMFMAAGLIYTGLGHDRIAELHGVGRALPITVFAFKAPALETTMIGPSFRSIISGSTMLHSQ